jgi:hypothetical protein
MLSFLKRLMPWLRSEEQPDNGPLRYDVDITDLGERGLEVVLSVSNAANDTVHLWGGELEVDYDGKDGGVHQVAFADADRRGHIPLEPDGFIQGHTHLVPPKRYLRFHCRVHLDYAFGDTTARKRISRRLRTEAIRKR